MGLSALSKPAKGQFRLKHLGIVAALAAEARGLVKQPTAPGELIHLPGGVLVQISGVGAKKASVAARALLREAATALVSWGSAGGLVSGLSPGSLILPKTVIAADHSVYPVDVAWHERLCGRLRGEMDFHTGPLVESSTVLTGSKEKKSLFSRTGAIAVDMESGAVAAVAQQAGVPFVAIRAIADPADMSIPQAALSAVDESGRLNLFKLARRIARRPGELLTLVRLGRSFRAAQVTLTAVARRTGNDLLAPEQDDK